MEYRSTERYAIEEFVNMGVAMVRVTNSQGMVTAILTPEQFEEQFEEIPAEVNPLE